MKRRVVIVLWYDAIAETGWCSRKRVEKLVRGNNVAKSVGIIVGKKKGYLLLAADFGTGSSPYNRNIAIPIRNIISLRAIGSG